MERLALICSGKEEAPLCKTQVWSLLARKECDILFPRIAALRFEPTLVVKLVEKIRDKLGMRKEMLPNDSASILLLSNREY